MQWNKNSTNISLGPIHHHFSMGTGFFPEDQVAGAWRWSLTSI